MKHMRLTKFPRLHPSRLSGVFARPGDASSQGQPVLGRASSLFVKTLHDQYVGKQGAAQLSVELDGVELHFWLPEELDHVAEILSRTPLPTAYTLHKQDAGETALNSHWLSRLPKRAKTTKWRTRFIKFLASQPKPLREFRAFYGAA